MGNYGRETVVFFEIDQPLCVHRYGDGLVSPTPASGCMAVLGVDGERKCHNTRFTCQDPANYSAGTLTLRFSRPQEGLQQYGTFLPQIRGEIDTNPGSINLAAMDQNASALGEREEISDVFQDAKHSDFQVDKYRFERISGAAATGSPPETYDPFERGSFWGKWLARNPYFSGYPCRVREGFLGDALEDMRVRHYVIDRIDGPNDGVVKLVAIDLFSKIEALKARAPIASQGSLDSGISAVDGTATLSPTGIGNEEYPTSFYAVIGKEAILITRSGDNLTLTERGALGTTAAAHDEEDLVQLVLGYTTEQPHRMIYDLLVNYSSIPASAIDLDEWDARMAGIADLYSGYVTKPTSVIELIGEICEQAGITVWPDVSTGMIRLVALRPSAPSVVVDDSGWIVDGSISLKRKTEKRASEIWVYYGQKNPVEEKDDSQNYHSCAVSADLEAEGDDQYGAPAIREVFSRWIPQFGRALAASAGERILAMFRDVPVEASFTLHVSKDGELDLAEPFTLRTEELQDETGDVLDVTYVPIQIERGENQINVVAQQATFSAGDNDLGGDTREIFLENDAFNLNLRTIHDSLFTAPEGGSPGETVTFTFVDGVTVGSTSTGAYAMDTGDWPAGVTLNLITAGGRIQGKGGAGGTGRSHSTPGLAETSGGDGGDALLVRVPINIDNLDGEIWGGGGGGGGGGGQTEFTLPFQDGGDGGGGAGTEAGPGGPEASAGTADAGGAGQLGSGAPGLYGNGGAGGSPGQAGTGGEPSSAGHPSGGSSGGAAGRYVVGNSFVNWINNGDRRGGVA